MWMSGHRENVSKDNQDLLEGCLIALKEIFDQGSPNLFV